MSTGAEAAEAARAGHGVEASTAGGSSRSRAVSDPRLPACLEDPVDEEGGNNEGGAQDEVLFKGPNDEVALEECRRVGRE